MASFLSLLKNPAWDAVLVFMLVAAGFFWGVSGGKKKMALGILALYALLAIFPYIPIDTFAAGRSPSEIFMFRAGIFLTLLLLLALFLMRSFKGATGYSGGLWWEILVLSILAAGFLAASIIKLAPEDIIKNNLLNLSPFVLQVFTSSAYAKWWFILPAFGVLFL
ncbi:MAG: hypothetical protein HYW15_02245 [Candidatus Giovannonibacteria bacterium]|nr:MAG: hypothetical protein HYW15_02245 [Candidatus Giovannonibacteria bacterium]